ncbi:hypothetical protein AMEX_G17858 [Astyanax mexicanus]|uniref:Ig-like domain-containing protein n=1 Tax=Astyanax mexicanus TaxID=7994 RepID=A0A8T2LG23_ASTMX|nr:hypothetical protein AMEX_G17858 [Astyanax mexicanus]
MTLVCVGFVLIIFMKSTEGLSITQDPTLIIKDYGDSVKAECWHNDSTYYYMYWYKQGILGQIELIALSIGKGMSQIAAPFNESKYSMTRVEVKHGILEIQKLEAEDSAVYFCAASRAQ